MKLSLGLKKFLKCLMRSKGKDSYVCSLPQGARLMDIGCGNNSPVRVKELRADLYYIGLDVQDYKQGDISKSMADEYRIVCPHEFLGAISSEMGSMDGILSAHNIEHCANRYEILASMCAALKINGTLYLSFPSMASSNLPSRAGTLRYKDDPTHVEDPPAFSMVIDVLKNEGMDIAFCQERYRPFLPLLIGFILEPWSRFYGRVAPFGSTWALYGFETVIWARKAR